MSKPSRPAAVLRDVSLPAAGDVSHPAAGDTSNADQVGVRRICAWCSGPIPERARRDAITCSKSCRQARNRHAHGARPVARRPGGERRVAPHASDATPLRLAYADPPYPGKAWLYRDHPDYAGEVDHAALIARLAAYDGWALSTSAAALPAVLALCPPEVRVAAWVRGERPGRSRWPLNAWEPVIYAGGRQQVSRSDAVGARRVADDDPSHSDDVGKRRLADASPGTRPARRVDTLVHGVTPYTTLPGRVNGTKPAAFCRWVFELLGAAPGDSLDDLFPGSGAVARAWACFAGSPLPEVLSARGV